MRWLTAILALLLLGLAAFPATVESVSAWITHRADSVQSINYPRRSELSASRRVRRIGAS
jgi:hypothetical protein